MSEVAKAALWYLFWIGVPVSSTRRPPQLIWLNAARVLLPLTFLSRCASSQTSKSTLMVFSASMLEAVRSYEMIKTGLLTSVLNRAIISCRFHNADAMSLGSAAL